MLELLGDSGMDFQASVVLTYRLDFCLYDGLIRRALNRAGIWNQVVFCDFGAYVEEVHSQSSTRHLGRQYSVTPVHQAGAFHPKVYLLLGSRHGRALVGSGNATVGGLIRNAEVFGAFDFDADKDGAPHPVFSEVLRLTRELAERSSHTVQRQIKSAERIAPWLSAQPSGDGRRVLIGGPGRTALLQQVVSALPSEQVDGLVVSSSSFDRRLRGLRRLAQVSRKAPTCIVQADSLEIDGAEVARLGRQVIWRPFIDPYPKERRKRRDVRAHAKVFVFAHGSTETCVFGSANASEPALGSRNTEVVVALPPVARGETVRRLGLDLSLKEAPVDRLLATKVWTQAEGEEAAAAFSCLLVGVASEEAGFRLSFADEGPAKGAVLCLAERHHGQAAARIAITGEDGEWFASARAADGALRFAWIETASGKVISNATAVTWPEVANIRRAHGLSAKVSQSLAAIQDGAMLGAVLFELLDQFRDFEVIRAAVGKRVAREAAAAEPEVAEEREAEYFYTDARPDVTQVHHWTGDRIDLDILAGLVQPLTPTRKHQEPVEDDDDYDDSRLAEEAERRELDTKKGKASGEERKEAAAASSERLERAVRRLERRLDRAAAAIEDSLDYLDRLETVPPQALARQIWMTHIGAFLAGRPAVSDEGDEFVCLAPSVFAEYVLRVARSLVGSRRGGLLDKVDESAWDSFDGENLRKGLAFLMACVNWAAAHLVDYYEKQAKGDDVPSSLAIGAPELVAARFNCGVRRFCQEPDQTNIDRRFPAWREVDSKHFHESARRIEQVSSTIDEIEGKALSSRLGTEEDAVGLAAGSLVFNPKLGVTVLTEASGTRDFHLLDLSRSADDAPKYATLVFPALPDKNEIARLRCWFGAADSS